MGIKKIITSDITNNQISISENKTGWFTITINEDDKKDDSVFVFENNNDIEMFIKIINEEFANYKE